MLRDAREWLAEVLYAAAVKIRPQSVQKPVDLGTRPRTGAEYVRLAEMRDAGLIPLDVARQQLLRSLPPGMRL